MKARANKPRRKTNENQVDRKDDQLTPLSESQLTPGEKWKIPDPTVPERMLNLDPTEPEKEEPESKDTKKKPALTPRRNPAQAELNRDQDLGEFIERDIDELGITGEEKEQEEDLEEEIEEDEEDMVSRTLQPRAIEHLLPAEPNKKAG